MRSQAIAESRLMLLWGGLWRDLGYIGWRNGGWRGRRGLHQSGLDRGRGGRLRLFLSRPRGAAALFHVLFELRLSPQDMVITLRETVCFIPHVLQQLEADVVALEPHRLVRPLHVNQLFFFGQ